MPQTAFNPQTDGFAFANSWTLDKATSDTIHSQMSGAMDEVFTLLAPVSALRPLRSVVRQTVDEWVSNASTQVYGLCGGMAFAALDYYMARRELPKENGPTDQLTPELRGYIWKRMKDSLSPRNVARVLAWMVVEHYVPLGSGKRLLLRWSKAEWKDLNRRIVENGAWPIALIGETKDPGHNHQVLAYQRSEPAEEHGVVYVYDMNCPGAGRKISMKFDGPALEADEDCASVLRGPLRGFFCEGYSPVIPPV